MSQLWLEEDCNYRLNWLLNTSTGWRIGQGVIFTAFWRKSRSIVQVFGHLSVPSIDRKFMLSSRRCWSWQLVTNNGPNSESFEFVSAIHLTNASFFIVDHTLQLPRTQCLHLYKWSIKGSLNAVAVVETVNHLVAAFVLCYVDSFEWFGFSSDTQTNCQLIIIYQL